MNNLYRKLNLPFDIVTLDFPKEQGTFEHLTDVTMFSYSKKLIDPRLLALINDCGMVVYWTEIFYNPPHTIVPVHVDAGQLSSMTKINIHAGHADCTIKWYTPLPEYTNKKPQLTPLNTEYLMYDEDEVNVIHSRGIDHVSIMNAGVPHSFENNTNEPSWILSIVLFKDGRNAQFEEVTELFDIYIEE